MRVTNSMVVNQFMSGSNKTLGRVQDAWSQVNSSKKINNIADDPLATIAALKARNRLSSLKGYQSTITTADTYLTEAETAAGGVNKLLQSAYDLITSANSGTKGEDELQAIAGDMENLRDELLAIANSAIGTTFLFGGDNSIRQPFTVDEAGTLYYNGVNLSGLALSDDYNTATEEITKGIEEIGKLIEDLDDVSPYNAQNTVGVAIIERMKKIDTAIQTAYDSAMRYSGMDVDYDIKVNAGGEASILNQLMDMRDQINTIKDSLFNEMSQELYYDTTDFDAEEIANGFRIEDCKAVLDEFAALTGLDGTSPNKVADTLTAAKIELPADMQAQIEEELAVKKQLKIGPTAMIDISANGLDFMGTGASNYYCLLDKCVRVLNGELDQSLLTDMVGDIQNALSTNSAVRTKFGASIERIEMLTDRYNTSELTYTEMLAEAEDVDLAEAIMIWKTAQTVYDGALAAGSKVIQTSLLDFLR